MQELLHEISRCTICSDFLDHEPNPVLSASEKAKIVIIGQAPGKRVHETGIPWNDKSGDNLRNWLGIDKNTFYNTDLFALIPMGFCYPGKGKSGNLPPRKECVMEWHEQVMQTFQQVELIILIGKYSQEHYLKSSSKKTLTETVKNYTEYLPKYFTLPHPSPRNNIWQAKNTWFKESILPHLKEKVHKLL